jgi:benzoyl-CoA-dihydrodiol lyase
MTFIDFQTDPSKYRHWRIETDGDVARLIMDVDETGGLFQGYELKLNSYDLGVDIELADAIQRLRFEHPEVRAVIVQSGKDRVFCAGANIRMLAGASHAHKVNFCKFTNETRASIEDASEHSGQTYIAAVKGACAGGGYELALATDRIMLTDDGSSTVALPEVPLLAVLPGTGGLTRVTDKRKVRRDRADVFCTLEEGIKGRRAVEWRLVDEVVPNAKFDDVVMTRAKEIAERNRDDASRTGIKLPPLDRSITESGVRYSHVDVELDRAARIATLTITGPAAEPPRTMEELLTAAPKTWALVTVRELDDAILHLRANEPEIGALVFKTMGDIASVADHENALIELKEFWLANEILLLWMRALKRIDVTSRSLVALIEPGSCFAGPLAELAFAADRSYMLDGELDGDNRAAAMIRLTEGNFGRYPMPNGLSRLETRFLGEPGAIAKTRGKIDEPLDAEAADDLGLVTFAYDDIDYEDEVRIFLEERTKFSPDAMTGMEANLRFPGPETMETKIFARLTAWQNWIFQRPNAVGEHGALRRYGTGQRADFDMTRV